MAPVVYHVRGHQDGELSAAQDRIARTLGQACLKLNFEFHSLAPTVDGFKKGLLESAPTNSIIYYDGHGNSDGTIVLSDGFLSGDQIREYRRHAIVFLHCCYSVVIATVDPHIGENLRSTIATLLAYGEGNVRVEVDRVMNEIQNNLERMEDPGFTAERIARQLEMIGLDRFGLFWKGVCPFSIGQLNTENDDTLVQSFVRLLDIFRLTTY